MELLTREECKKRSATLRAIKYYRVKKGERK